MVLVGNFYPTPRGVIKVVFLRAPFEKLQENLGVTPQIHIFFGVGIVGAGGVW